MFFFFFFFFNDTATTEIYTLSLHDALPINVVAQAYWDPRLGLGVLGLMLPVLTAFFATGRVGRSREQAAQVLRQRSAELRRQRERTARVAVLAERGRVAASLDATLHAEIGRIRDDAAAALRALDTDP